MAAEDYLPDGGLFPDDDWDDYECPKGLYRRPSRMIVYDSLTKMSGNLAKQIANRVKETEMLDVKKMNKFYVASPDISTPVQNGKNANWTRKTLAEATEHAQELLSRDNSGQEVMLIVKIVRIVKRAKAPIQIQDIK